MNQHGTTVFSGEALASLRTNPPARVPTHAKQLRPDTRWRLSWLLLTLALAGHVADEAATDFLSFYNPAIETIRESLPWLPLPSFTFDAWITGLVAGILVLAALTPFAGDGRTWMRRLSYVYGIIMMLNGLGHLGGSLLLGRWLPGVVSSPFLLAAALLLLTSVAAATRARGAGPRGDRKQLRSSTTPLPRGQSV